MVERRRRLDPVALQQLIGRLDITGVKDHDRALRVRARFPGPIGRRVDREVDSAYLASKVRGLVLMHLVLEREREGIAVERRQARSVVADQQDRPDAVDQLLSIIGL